MQLNGVAKKFGISNYVTKLHQLHRMYHMVSKDTQLTNGFEESGRG